MKRRLGLRCPTTGSQNITACRTKLWIIHIYHWILYQIQTPLDTFRLLIKIKVFVKLLQKGKNTNSTKKFREGDSLLVAYLGFKYFNRSTIVSPRIQI